MKNVTTANWNWAICILSGLLSVNALAELPFVGILEFDIHSNSVTALEPWLVPNRETLVKDPICQAAIMSTTPEKTYFSNHFEMVTAKLLTGLNEHDITYARQNPSRYPIQQRILPISLTSELMYSPNALYNCLRELHEAGMQTVEISAGIETGAPNGYGPVAKAFETAIINLPRLTFVLAAGNEGISLYLNRKEPQSLCESFHENLFCVTAHRNFVSNSLEANIAGVDVSRLNAKYGEYAHEAKGTPSDPLQLTRNYSTVVPLLSCDGCESTSFAAPALVRAFLLSGASTMSDFAARISPRSAKFATESSPVVTIRPFSLTSKLSDTTANSEPRPVSKSVRKSKGKPKAKQKANAIRR